MELLVLFPIYFLSKSPTTRCTKSREAMETYDSELKPIAPRNAAAFLANLENGLTQLNDAVRNKASPMGIMVIVHTQVQTSLLQAFGLELR